MDAVKAKSIPLRIVENNTKIPIYRQYLEIPNINEIHSMPDYHI